MVLILRVFLRSVDCIYADTLLAFVSCLFAVGMSLGTDENIAAAYEEALKVSFE